MNITIATNIMSLLSASLQLLYISDIIQDVLHPNMKLLYCSDNNLNDIDVFSNYYKIVTVINNNITYDLNLKLMFGRMDAYFFHFKQPKFSYTFDQLSKMRSWNSRAKSIIYLEQFNDFIWKELITVLIKHYIYNVIIVSNNRVYTYYPYKYENLNNPQTDYEEITNNLYFPQKIPSVWRNSTICPQFIQFLPYYAVYNKLKDGRSGTDFTMYNEIIIKHLKLKEKRINFLSYWGTKLPNGNYNGGLSVVQKRQADILIGSVSNNHQDIFIDFDATNMYYDDRVLWMVVTAREQTDFFQLVYTFHRITWIFILITGIVLTAAWIFFAKCSSTELMYFKHLWNSSTTILRFFFAEVESYTPRTTRLKFLHLLTWVFSFMIGSAFEGALIGKLTMKEYEHQISTVQEVIDNKLTITMPSFIRTSFDSDDPRDRYIYNNTVVTDDVKQVEATIVALKRYRNVTFCTTQRNYNYFLLRRNTTLHDFVYADGTPAVYPLEDFAILYFIIVVLQKGHPMFEQIDRMMVGVLEGGIYLNFMELLLHRARVHDHIVDVKRITSKAINYDQIAGLVYILMFGLGVAFVVFCFELLLNRKNFGEILVVP